MGTKKNLTKSIAIALVGVSVVTPICNTISAMEITDVKSNYNIELMNEYGIDEQERTIIETERDSMTLDTGIEERFSDEQIKLLKIEFQEIHGNTDEFKQYEEEDGTITEVNGYRGIIKVTNAESGEVVELDLFESYDNLNSSNNTNFENSDNSDLSTYATPSIPTGGHSTKSPADKANLKGTVSGSNVKLSARNPVTGTYKNYTKSKSNWYTGSTKGYYLGVQGARRSWGTSMSNYTASLQTFAIACASNLVQKQQFNQSATSISKFFKNAGLAASAGTAFEGCRYLAAYIVEVGRTFTHYMGM